MKFFLNLDFFLLAAGLVSSGALVAAIVVCSLGSAVMEWWEKRTRGERAGLVELESERPKEYRVVYFGQPIEPGDELQTNEGWRVIPECWHGINVPSGMRVRRPA